MNCCSTSRAVERIRQDPRTKLLPVVVLTSSREEPDIQKSYGLGVNSYIVKPVDFEAFVRAASETARVHPRMPRTP